MDYSFQPLIAKIDQFLSSPEASAFLDRYQNNVFVKKYFCDSLMKSLNEIKNELTGSMVNQIEVDELSAVLEDGFAVGFSFSNPDAFIENLYKKCETIVKLIHRSKLQSSFDQNSSF